MGKSLRTGGQNSRASVSILGLQEAVGKSGKTCRGRNDFAVSILGLQEAVGKSGKTCRGRNDFAVSILGLQEAVGKLFWVDVVSHKKIKFQSLVCRKRWVNISGIEFSHKRIEVSILGLQEAVGKSGA